MDGTDDRETSRYRSRGGPGRLATFGGAALLVLLGFFLGLVAGAIFEEPRLVIDHVAGNTTDVPLDAPVPAEGMPSGAPSPPEPGPEQAAAPVVEAPPAGRPLGGPQGGEPATLPPTGSAVSAPGAPAAAAPAPAVSSAPPSGFEIQVGAFGERGAADALVAKLSRAGFQARVVPTDGAARFKVRVGPYASRADAESRARALKAEHRLPTWVVSPDAG